jgi:acyl carrier protein
MSDLTLTRLRDLLQETSPAQDWSGLGLEDSLADAGLDSLDKATLIMRLEDETGHTIPDDVYERLDTPARIFAHLSVDTPSHG